MLDFPRWKITLVLLVCLSGFYFALPNFLSAEKRTDFSSFLSEETVKLGLDLQGGSYLLLEVDFDTYLDEQLQILVDDIRIKLRKDKIGYRGLKAKDGKVTLALRNPSDKEKVEEILSDLFREVSLDIDESGATELTYRDEYLKVLKQNIIGQSIEIVRRRVDETGTREPIIQRQGDLRILLQVPGLENPEHLKKLLGKTAKMTFHLMDKNNPYPAKEAVPPIDDKVIKAKTAEGTEIDLVVKDPEQIRAELLKEREIKLFNKRAKRVPAGTKLLMGDSIEDQTYYLIKKKVMLSGDLLVDSRASFDQGRPVVSFRFNNKGARKFGKITKENTGRPFAIVLDDKVISAPRINEPILGGSGIITGNFSVAEANDLALLLRAGALPAPIEILEERSVGPSLGQDSINAGKIASIFGIVLVMVLMLLFYGRFGLFSDIALLTNMILILAVLSFFQATLTLPGIAGIVLTMGMAVDANVLIFERIKEEISIGKTPFAAIDHGFKQAFKTIIDSNITTLIATLLLFIYGSGPVKGFAVTLSVGILCSMFSAILLTRMMIVLWLKKNRPSKLSI